MQLKKCKPPQKKVYKRHAHSLVTMIHFPLGKVKFNSDYCRRERIKGAYIRNYGKYQAFEIHLARGKWDAEAVFTLAHELGHYVTCRGGSSLSLYIKEYQADCYALTCMRFLKLSSVPHIEHSRRNVKRHCRRRHLSMQAAYGYSADAPDLYWSGKVIEWARYKPHKPSVNPRDIFNRRKNDNEQDCFHY